MDKNPNLGDADYGKQGGSKGILPWFSVRPHSAQRPNFDTSNNEPAQLFSPGQLGDTIMPGSRPHDELGALRKGEVAAGKVTEALHRHGLDAGGVVFPVVGGQAVQNA